VGGLLVAVVAPLVFNAYHELALGLLAACALAVGMYWRLHWIARLFARALLICAVGGFAYDAFKFRDGASLTTRNFYGVLRVKSYGAPGEPEYSRRLLHGVIMHGEQYLTGDASRRLTTYYQRDSGIGKAIESRGKDPVHVGVIGLGVGTLAGYGRAGDTYRIYEINPAVLQIARTQFKYLTESPAKVDVVLGDARLNLEREPSQQFDVLAIDAFSSDSIPVHLITREALGVYLRHLKPNGIVAFHVSNRFLELAPVVAQIAAEHGAVARVVEQSAKDEDDTTSDWVLVSRDPSALQGPVLKDIAQEVKLRTQWRVWTDDYSNLIQILK
jgi:SAM-dependent methyltransferase